MSNTVSDQAVNLEIVSRMPWLLAEEESIWSITGSYGGDNGAFKDCLAMVLPFGTTDGHRLFVLIHPNQHTNPTFAFRFITPDRISRARRLVLVDADDPKTAHFADEQDLVDRAHI
ncbi:hypothetical protein ACWEO2_39945 [Nocardia sp. NPDC004278]